MTEDAERTPGEPAEPTDGQGREDDAIRSARLEALDEMTREALKDGTYHLGWVYCDKHPETVIPCRRCMYRVTRDTPVGPDIDLDEETVYDSAGNRITGCDCSDCSRVDKILRVSSTEV